MLSIYKKEINAFFSTLVGYIVIGIFLLSLGWVMWIYNGTSILDNEFATLDQLFIGAPVILSFIIPAITMRSFAEEYQIGTIELLTTKPVLDLDIILGKFLACMTLVVLMLLPTLVYYYSVYQLGSPVGNIDTGGVIGSYIGLLLLSAAFVAIGLLFSSLARNIIVSLILGIFGCLFFHYGFGFISEIPNFFGKGDIIIQMLGIEYHYLSVRRGVLDTRDLFYFISLTGILLSATLISFNRRKWMVTDEANSKDIKIPLIAASIVFLLLVGLLFIPIGAKTSIFIGVQAALITFYITDALRNRNASIFHALVQPLIAIPIFVGLAILSNFIFTKFDLTDDKRFTLTDRSVEVVRNIDEVMDITVLLEGDIPADYKRLQNAVEELLDDFRSYNRDLEYKFENPTADPDLEEVQKNVGALQEQGIQPVVIDVPNVDSRKIQQIFPFALIHYKGRTVKVNLLEEVKRGMSEQANISKSINLLEFKFVNAITKLEVSYRPVITYTINHDELQPLQFADLRKTLSSYYDLGGLDLDSLVEISQDIDILIVPKPRLAFSDKQLFKIDQYIMNGGKVIWAIDVMDMSIDSLGARRGAPYISSELPAAEGIGNLLFRYGLRIRPANFVFDVESSRIPLQTGVQGNTPQFDLFPWFYHPIISPKTDHPIVKGLDRINMYFPTVIDTAVSVRTNMKKEVLLTTSKYTRIRPNTHRFNFEEVNIDPQVMEFTAPNQPVAVLLEGIIPSAYRNRVSEAMSRSLQSIGVAVKEESVPNKMIVISDGDIMKNLVSTQNNQYSPLGFNKYENYTFANKDFMINCIEYLMDDSGGVLDSRSKEIELRLLDTVSAQKNKLNWQLLNVLLPIVLLTLGGLIFNYLRKRKYASRPVLSQNVREDNSNSNFKEKKK